MGASAPTLEELLSAAGRGDHDAFSEIYARTSAHLFGVAVRILGRSQSAEEVLQEAFVSVWKNAGNFRGEIGGQPIQPMTWLITIVRNKALDALRARTRMPETELDAFDDEEEADGFTQAASPSALELFSAATESLRIERCMEALQGTHRQSLALAYYQGLSHTEVALQMGVPLGSVKAWIRRGLEKLRDCLQPQGAGA
ncbi:sigma-70 family RNA polymerase sigma factor [Ramlibacter sp. USB13]|uniref:Sigma-70 family RNA polymerase sigma factor n=1 Tax=Ramlibacter cellulosilyticus TaxID=2764187 RepID=A0A923MMH9_9BURK|nr:sigma-70 family RNA polymerase sigma factor [Ramlibacter cellulosilyticus]MBC5781398.1 sigma-70 family RNA polymerase sigma factor [Ramlibacter cellulosilyticus]